LLQPLEKVEVFKSQKANKEKNRPDDQHGNPPESF
jgi:hypothetical protein